ncbi:IS5 family transposase [Primorskyibacter flagellatus]|uniref:IS5 family transposase n=1 Tax=Primorskyibacter flagellatus TaxID=1387277 RepID=UPI003A95CA21
MSSWAPTKYKTKNWPSYNTALKQRGSLSIWFDPEMVWTPPPSGKRGRQQQFSDAAIQTCLTLKVLFGMPLRQTTGFVQSLLQLVGLNWAVPDVSTLCRRQRTLSVRLPHRGSKGPLNLLIDSTGIKAEGEGEWNARKHDGSKRRIWRKIHIGIDEKTLEVRAVEVTGSNIGDAPMLPELLNQIPSDQDIGSVTADGAYDTRKCHEAIAARNAHAVIPPRKNAKPWKPPIVHAGMHCRAMDERRSCCPKRRGQCTTIPGPDTLASWSGYHRRSRVETKMHCIKLLGQSLMARDFERQVAEIHVRISVLNSYTALGIPVTEPVA